MVIYSSHRARQSLFYTTGFRVVSQLATLLSYIVLVRSMEERAFGVFNLLYSVIPVIASLSSLGLEQTLRRFQPEYLQAGNTSLAARLVRFVMMARLATSLLGVGVILLSWNLVAQYFDLQDYRVDFAVFGILIVLYFQLMILQYSLASHMLHSFSVGSVAVLSVGKLIAYLIVSYFGAMTLRAAIICDIAAYGLAYLFLCVAHHKLATPRPPTDTSAIGPTDRKRLTRFAAFNHFNDAASLLCYSQTDNFFVGGMLGPVAVATYSFYTRLTEMINQIIPIRLFENIIQPMFYAVPRAEADARVPRYLTLLMDVNLVLQLPAIAFAVVYHREFVELFFGGKYADDSMLLPLVVAMAAISNILTLPVTLVAQYYERASTILVSEIFGIYQVVAMLVLVPTFGLYGAALSTGSFNLLRNLFVWWRLGPRVRWLNARAVVIMSVLIWGSLIALCMTLRALLPVPPVVDLIVGAIACSLGVLLYVRSPALSQSDREILANLMHGKEARLLAWLGLQPRDHRLRDPGRQG